MTTRRIQRLARRAGLAQAEEMTALQARIAALEAHRDMTNASIRELQEWNTELARRIGDVEAQRLDEIARQLVEASRTVPGMANLTLERFDAGPAGTVLGFSGAAAPASPDASYLSFENTFRGSEELIASRQRVYVDLLAGHAPVLDIGCWARRTAGAAARRWDRRLRRRRRSGDGRAQPSQRAGRRGGQCGERADSRRGPISRRGYRKSGD